jgi:meso-butanediol dehydrogenase/(S,S)-butanediol dehydrogenase/diacetyl reductase
MSPPFVRSDEADGNASILIRDEGVRRSPLLSFPTMELQGRIALVTGAGQGVGRGIALALGRAGATVILTGRTRAKLEAVRDDLGSGLALEADMTDRAQIGRVVERIAAEHGRLDCLVNAAYDARVGLFDALTAEDARWDWNSGFAGPLRCMQACFPLLARSRGNVINVGAATGLKPETSTFALYASTKEALRSLTRTAAVEWAAQGIRVNALIPLATSPSFEDWGERNPAAFQTILDSIPLAYLGDPELDVGPGAVFLASDDAHFLTGTTLMLDGGRGYLR